MADNQQPPEIDLTNEPPIPADYNALTRMLGFEVRDYINLTEVLPIPSDLSALTKDLSFQEKSTSYQRPPETTVRARIAYLLLGFLGGALVLSFAALFTTFFFSTKDQATAWGNAKDLLEVVVPTLTTLIGSIVGFYFGSQSQNQNPNG